ncbi:MAG: Wzz/FepE/Etk N-terminal domain-containing protein [Chloroflexota bacterium]
MALERLIPANASGGVAVLVRSILAVVVLTAVAATAAFGITSAAPKVYTAETQLVVTAGLGLDVTGDVITAPRLAQTYGTLALTRPVLQRVISDLELPYSPEDLGLQVQVATDASSPFIIIAVTNESAVRAEETANALGDILVELSTVEGAAGEPDEAILAIVERAATPLEPSGPRVLFNTIIAAAVTLVLAVAAVAAIAYARSEPGYPQESAE